MMLSPLATPLAPDEYAYALQEFGDLMHQHELPIPGSVGTVSGAPQMFVTLLTESDLEAWRAIFVDDQGVHRTIVRHVSSTTCTYTARGETPGGVAVTLYARISEGAQAWMR